MEAPSISYFSCYSLVAHEHVYREANKAADRLARWNGSLIFGDTPSSIEEIKEIKGNTPLVSVVFWAFLPRISTQKKKKKEIKEKL